MSFLFDDLLPAPPLLGRRQIDPGTVGIERDDTTAGFCYSELLSTSPSISLEHWLLRPGRAPSQGYDTKVQESATQHDDRQEFFDWVADAYPSEAASFVYDAVLCLSRAGIPNGGVGGPSNNIVVKARVLYNNTLAGFVYVHSVPTVSGRLVEHWALMPGYDAPESTNHVRFVPLVAGPDNDVLGATSPDAFLQAMFTRQGQDTWTWVLGQVTRTIGIPT